MTIRMTAHQYCTRKLEKPCSACVSAGSSPTPGRLLKTSSNFGTTKIMMSNRMSNVTIATTAG